MKLYSISHAFLTNIDYIIFLIDMQIDLSGYYINNLIREMILFSCLFFLKFVESKYLKVSKISCNRLQSF